MASVKNERYDKFCRRIVYPFLKEVESKPTKTLVLNIHGKKGRVTGVRREENEAVEMDPTDV